jgi:hypothetical protein
MAYEVTNPPRCIVPAGITGPAIFYYFDGDAHGTVDGSGYFTDGTKYGMKLGDIVYVVNSSDYTITTHAVSVVSGTAVTISAAVLA